MSSKEDACTAMGVIGNITALVLFLSPAPTFYRIWKKKSVDQYSPLPYLTAFINCGLWVLYGLPLVHPNSTLIITINGAGFVIETVYLSLFFIFTESKNNRLRLVEIVVAECIFMAALALLVLNVIHNTKLRSTIVGSICVVGTVIMYASPLAIMKMVITTRSVEFMPFFLSLFSFLNGISWTAYALIRFDPFIVVPNGMGAVLGLAQLVVYAIFHRSTKRMMAERKAKEVALAQNGHVNGV